MSRFDGMLKEELRQEALNRGLPVSGTNAELVARLEGHDRAKADADGEPDLVELAEDDPEPTTGPLDDPEFERAAKRAADLAFQQTGSRIGPASDPDEPDEPVMDGEVSPGLFTYKLRCDGELSTAAHLENIEKVRTLAIRQGLSVRGSAYRSGWAQENGHRHAVYQISLRR